MMKSKLTIALDDSLKRAAKIYALKHDTTITALIEEALKALLEREAIHERELES